ncbi:MAG: HlyD family efflux transporter periplasmic adaptor subunit [Pirellulaceae bacterium]
MRLILTILTPVVLLISSCMVRVTTAQERSITVEDSVVRFGEEIRVPAVEAGRLVELKVKRNEIVTGGQLLARQDDSAHLLQRRSATWQQTAAREESSDEIDLEYARALYAEAVAQRDADAGVYQKGGGSMRSVRQSELAVQRAHLEIQRAEKALRLARIQLELRTAELTAIDDQLQRLQIRSPIAGVVLTVDRRVGEWIREGETLATIVRMDRLQIDAFLSNDQLRSSEAVGSPISVTWSDFGKSRRLTGTVDSVDPQVLTGNRYRLHATVENVKSDEGWLLVPGMDVMVNVHPKTAAR